MSDDATIRREHVITLHEQRCFDCGRWRACEFTHSAVCPLCRAAWRSTCVHVGSPARQDRIGHFGGLDARARPAR